MAVVTVTTALTALAPALDRPSGRTAVLVQAEGTVYVSKSATLTADATTTGGVVLSSGQVYEDELERGATLYGRTASGSVVVRVETGAAS